MKASFNRFDLILREGITKVKKVEILLKELYKD